MDAGTVAQRVAAFRAALASAPAAHGGAGGAKGRRPSEYAYINLGDLVLSRFKGCEVNVYAVVAGFTQPRRTGGTDHMCSLLLVHPSRAAQPRRVPAPGQEEGDWPLEAVHPMQLVDRAKVVCNVFRPSVEKLPQPLRVGEVVRLHRVRVNEFQGNVQLLCHKKAHFLLVRRRRDHPQAGEGGAAAAVWEEAAWERVTSSETHTFTDADRQAVPALWDWAHREFLPAASLVDNFIRGPRTVEQVRKRLQNLPWQPRTAQGGGEGDGGEGEEDGPQPPMPPMPPAPSQQDDRQVGDFVGLVVARPGADALVVWDGTDVPAPGFVAGATAPSAAVVRALHAALGAARGREGRPEWGAALGEDAGEVGVPSVEHLGAMMKEAGRLDVYLPGVHRWRFQRLVDAGKAAPGTWVRMRHLEVQEVSVQEQLGLNPRVGVGLAAPGGGAGGRTTLRAAAGMLSSLNPLPPYCLDAQRVACRFLARQRRE